MGKPIITTEPTVPFGDDKPTETLFSLREPLRALIIPEGNCDLSGEALTHDVGHSLFVP
jgi:hypothetical protein